MRTRGTNAPDNGGAKARGKLATLCAALIFTLAAFLPQAGAHEPITTRVRFNKEVIRMLQRNCLGCHRPGGIAMSLATYEEARPWAKSIKEELLEKRMPPWHAVKGYGQFANGPQLTQREIDVIVNWVEGGAPRGKESDLPSPLLPEGWQLGQPSLIARPDAPHKVAADADEEKSFVLPLNLKGDRFLSAIDLQPGNAAVVFAATILLEGGPPAVLATWMPGQRVVALPQGVARRLPAGARLVLKIRYRGNGEETTDQSQVGLYFAAEPPRRLAAEVDIRNDEPIPAGAAAHRLVASHTVEEDTEAVAIRPQPHGLLTSLQVTAYRPDGSQEVLIWSRGYKFDWRPTFQFRRPVPLPKGTRVEAVAYFDNSAENFRNPNDPPKAVRWSELSKEPLCALIVAVPRVGD